MPVRIRPGNPAPSNGVDTGVRRYLEWILLCGVVLLAGLQLYYAEAPRRDSPTVPPFPAPAAPPPAPLSRIPLPSQGERVDDPVASTLRRVARYAGALNPAEASFEFVSLAVEGDRVYAGGVGGVTVFRLDAEGVPHHLAQQQQVGTAFRLMVQGDLLFAADREGNVSCLDVSGSAPRLLWQTGGPERGINFGMAVRGDLLFRAAGKEGLVVSRFTRKGVRDVLFQPLPASARDVALLEGPVVAVGLAEGGVRLFRIASTRPVALEPAGSLKLPGAVTRLKSSGSRLYAALGSYGLARMDCRDPRNPRLVYRLPRRHSVLDLDVSGEWIALAEWEAVGLVQDTGEGKPISRAQRAILHGDPTSRGLVTGVGWSGKRLVVGEWSTLQVLQLDPRVTDRQPSRPEPAAPLSPGVAAPAFELPTTEGGRIALEDLRGRPAFLFFFAEG